MEGEEHPLQTTWSGEWTHKNNGMNGWLTRGQCSSSVCREEVVVWLVDILSYAAARGVCN